jgi:hypothetical protein
MARRTNGAASSAARSPPWKTQIRQAETARDYLSHALQCPSEHPADQCPHLRGNLDRQLAAGPEHGENLPASLP